MTQPALGPSPRPPPQQSGMPVWVLVVLGMVGALVVFGGIFAAMGVYGVRRYIANAKAAEGRNGVGVLVKGVVACAAETGHLPQTSAAVPQQLESIRGKKYLSDPGEWGGDPTFTCAKFSMAYPQYFQYQWVLEDPDNGYAQAVADLDGDGIPELTLRLHARCTGGQCLVNPAIEELRRGR